MLKIGDGVILLSSLPLGACTLTSLLSLSFSLTPTLCPEPKSRLNWFASDYPLSRNSVMRDGTRLDLD